MYKSKGQSCLMQSHLTLKSCVQYPNTKPCSSSHMRMDTVVATSKHGGSENEVLHYSRKPIPRLSPTNAAIMLTFILKEAVALQIPPHLPPSRTVAIATHHSGPTMEDYQALESCKTPLFADTRSMIRSDAAKKTALADCTKKPETDTFVNDFLQETGGSYIPGMLTGVWEGTYMVRIVPESRGYKRRLKIPVQVSPLVPLDNSSSLTPSTSPDFLCRTPMQCAIAEYMCFSPHVPLPTDDISDEFHFRPGRLLESEVSEIPAFFGRCPITLCRMGLK